MRLALRSRARERKETTMSLARRKIEAMRGKEKALGLAFALGSVLLAGCTTLQLSPGPISGKTVYLDKALNYPYCEFEVVTGGPLEGITVQVYNTSGQERCLPGTLDRIDAEALAKKVGARAVVKNPTRYWLPDRLWSYDAGETRDFDGVKATWMASLKIDLAKAKREHDQPFPTYQEGTVARKSKYEWLKGSQVYLLRSPDGKTWVMAAYTTLVDKSLTPAELPQLGMKLKLPPGWKYEVKTLDRDFTLAPPASTGYLAHAVADDLQNVYQGCGFDDACNYIP
jgi:hypothetical protein